jgi:autotransporter-associated beta strand protein
MKPNYKNFCTIVALSLAFSTPQLSAAPIYWDINSDTLGAGGATPSGTWASSGTTWSTSSLGSATTSAYTTSNADDLFFSAGTDASGAYTIDLTTSQDAGSLTFEEGTATISGTGGIITLAGAGGNITVNGALSPVIGNNTTTIIGGAVGLTKLGTGTLNLNSSAVNTFTGGVRVSAGTLVLNYNNLATPTNLIDPTNALQINNGALTITGKNVAAATTDQTFADTSLGAGVNTINIAKGVSATSATLNLGMLTVNSGSATTFNTTAAWTTTASTTERVFITAGGSVPTLPSGATTAFVNAGVFNRITGGANGTLRLAAVNSSGQLLQKGNLANVSATNLTDSTASYQFSASSNVQLTNTGATAYSLLLNANSNGVPLTIANSGTLTLNSLIQIKSAQAVSINAGTGVSNLVIGSERNLVLAMDNSSSLTINAPIVNNGGGASALTIAGTAPTGTPGTVVLGGANTYSGATTITKGTLSLTNVDALQNTSGLTLGGTSAATLTTLINGITLAAPITLANSGVSSTIAFTRNTASPGSITLNGAISGGGNVIFTTPNTSSGGNVQSFNLGATGTYSGSTTMTTGNINNSTTIRNNSGAANVLPVTTVLTMSGGSGAGSGRTVTFDLNGQNQELAGLTNVTAADRNQRITSGTAATLTINNSADYTFGLNTTGADPGSGQLTGAVALTKKGAGTFTLASGIGHTHTGKTVVEAGILSVGNTNSLQNSAFDTSSSMTGTSTGGLRSTVTTLALGGLIGNKDFEDVFTTTGGGYTGLTALNLNPGSGVTHTYSADIGDGAGGMNLTKTGAGTQILAAAQTYTGTTTGSAGTLIASTTSALPGYNVASKVIFNGGTIGVQVGGAGWTTGEVDTLLSNATKTSGALGIDTTNGNLTQWTPFTTTNFGSLGLNKLGANDLTLDQANTYTGPTTVTAGTLTITNALALQNSSLVTTGAGTLVLSGVTTLNLGGLSGATGDLATIITGYSGVTAINLNTPATTPGGDFNYSGIISEGALGMTLTKNGVGVQALSGANTYTGATQIDGGILVFRNKASKSSATATAAAAGTIGLGVKTADATFYSEAEVGDLFNTNTLGGFSLDSASGVAIDTTNAGGSFDQTVALTAARSLTKLGSGTLVLSQVNSYSGSTSVLAGTLSLTGSLTGGGAIYTSGSSVLTQSAAGVISGASTLTQGSSETSTLNGANSYTGVTNVNLGQLIISHATSLGTTDGNTVVASGGRLVMATASLSVAEPLTISGTGTTATNGALNFAGGASGMAITGPITLGGAALIQADGSTGSTLSGGISLGANELSINTDGGATQTINTNAITGTGGSLVKSGSGTLVLGAENTYSGNTTVSAGTLTLADNAQLKFVLGATSGTSNSLTGAGTATLGGDFVIDTSAADALTTGTWTLENVTTATYGATFSVVGFVDAGDNKWTKDISSKRYTFDEATGVLTLAPAGNYASWANDPLKGNIPGALPADDFDNDGISNIVEYALGLNPRVSTQPAGVLSGNLIITYTKGADAIANGDVSWVIETSQTLADGSWTAQVTQPAADPALTISYTFTPGSPVKNFARLKVIQAPDS